MSGAEARAATGTPVGDARVQPIMKPTGFLTNSPALAEAMSRRCTGTGGECSRPGGGRHTLCSGRKARDAAIYPRGLCRAMIKGTVEQLGSTTSWKMDALVGRSQTTMPRPLRLSWGPSMGTEANAVTT